MFVLGGVFRAVKMSLLGTLSKFSVSALMFDYILTGPISVVSAGQYLGHLLDDIARMLGQSFPFNVNHFAAFFAVLVTVYFWWLNIKGIHESSGKALRIMQITTIMVVAFVIWCPLTILLRDHVYIPPAPLPRNLRFSPEALGWLKGTRWPSIPMVALIIAFGHSLLSMSGFETLAQVYREIAYPKMKNLRITANIVCWYAVICTGVITVFAGMLISPEDIRNMYADNLLGGLAMRLAGPELLKLAFHTFVVIVGILILSGAVNTSMIGANGVLNRVAEDGVLLDWFRKPQKKFGTTYRIINLIALMQITTIVMSRGDMYLLGEAYAFGVVWSFFLKSLGVLALRYQRHDQEYKFPFNLRISGVEFPIGLGLTTMILGFVAIANLFTKEIATIYGVAFTLALFAIFTISERVNERKRRLQHLDKKPLEEFNLDHQPQVSAGTLHARPGCVLVAVRDYHNMEHLRKVLQKTNLRRHDIVVMTVRTISAGAGEYELSDDQMFSDYERELFSHVVEIAEKEGKPVELLEVPAVNPFDAMVQSAARLKASRLVTGVSPRMPSEELARRIGLAWESLPEPRHAFSLEVISPDRPSIYVNLGPHPPRLWPEDVDRLHDLWLRLSNTEGVGAKLHHRDIVGVALRRLERDLSVGDRDQLLNDLKDELRKG
jgi:amino acid transporter